MPRRPRPDIRPEIRLPDTQPQQRRVNDLVTQQIGPNYSARLRRADEQPINDGWVTIFDEFRRRMDRLRQDKVHIDMDLMFFLIERCDKALFAPRMRDGAPVIEGGFRIGTLSRIGSRVCMTQKQIAEAFGCTESHVNKHINLMKQHDLIVNWGHGWYEFAAVLCWKGGFDLQAAYRDVQPSHSSMTIEGNVITYSDDDEEA